MPKSNAILCVTTGQMVNLHMMHLRIYKHMRLINAHAHNSSTTTKTKNKQQTNKKTPLWAYRELTFYSVHIESTIIYTHDVATRAYAHDIAVLGKILSSPQWPLRCIQQ